MASDKLEESLPDLICYSKVLPIKSYKADLFLLSLNYSTASNSTLDRSMAVDPNCPYIYDT